MAIVNKKSDFLSKFIKLGEKLMIKNKILSCINKIKLERKIIIYFIFVFLFMVILHLPQQPIQFTDEQDNFLGARVVSEGGVIYKDFYSQHTPLMYYIMSVFIKLGVNSIPWFRFFYYLLLISIFLFIYFRYNKHFGKITLLIFPVLFILDIARHFHMNSVLSDGIQSMSLIILFFEFYIYCIEKPKKIILSSIIIISLSIIGAIGTAFLSIYSIAVICLGVFLIEVERIHTEEKMKIIDRSKDILFRFLPIIFTIFGIVIIYIIYLLINNSLKNMIYQSYIFNIDIYSRYTNNYNSKLDTAINTINTYGNYIADKFKEIYNFNSILPVILIIANIGLSYLLFYKNKILSVITFLYTIFLGIRLYEGFHSMPYIVFSWFGVSYLFEHVIVKSKNKLLVFVCILIGIIGFFPLYSRDNKLNKIRDVILVFNKSEPNYYINKFVPNGGYFFSPSINMQLYIDNNVKRTGPIYAIVPWFADIYMDEIIENLKKNKPNIIFYDPYGSVWGIKYLDFCKKLEEYLKKEYIPYNDTIYSFEYIDSDSPNVWIHKDISEKINNENITFKLLNSIFPNNSNELLNYNFFNLSVNYNIHEIELNTGNIDPQFELILDKKLSYPQKLSFVELEYKNTNYGRLQIFYNYGSGYSEENSISINITNLSENNLIKLPIIGWNNKKELVSIRIDPPNDTKFIIKELNIINME